MLFLLFLLIDNLLFNFLDILAVVTGNFSLHSFNGDLHNNLSVSKKLTNNKNTTTYSKAYNNVFSYNFKSDNDNLINATIIADTNN